MPKMDDDDFSRGELDFLHDEKCTREREREEEKKERRRRRQRREIASAFSLDKLTTRIACFCRAFLNSRRRVSGRRSFGRGEGVDGGDVFVFSFVSEMLDVEASVLSRS